MIEIRIRWEYAVEHVGLDLAAGVDMAPITSTTEWWPNDEKWVKYSTNSTCWVDGKFLVIEITYERSKNPDLYGEAICWGRSIIRIDPDDPKSGKAEWIDTNNSKYNGVVKWKQVESALTSERVRTMASRLQREQAHFRRRLLLYDVGCVITGEKTLEAVEAAHIIPACEGGREIPENGILLRADLHRLYDAKLFSIDPEGKIVVDERVNDKYRKVLTSASIPAETLKRIGPALRHVEKTGSCPE